MKRDAEHPTLAAALELLDIGWPITVCDEKKPLGPDFDKVSNGFGWETHNWTADEVRRAFDLRGSLNVGVRLGPDAGFIDIETDNAEEEAAFARLFEGCEIPRTPMFKSTRGAHRLFAWSELLAIPGKAVLTYDGAKMLRVGANGLGAQSVIPPSVNVDGTVRQWLVSPADCPPARLPDIVLRRILEASKPEPPPSSVNLRNYTADQSPDRVAQAQRYMAKVPGAVEGNGGDDATFAAACVLVRDFDLSPDEAWPVFCDWNLTCQPPWDERRLRRKLNEADRQPGERGTKLRANSLNLGNYRGKPCNTALQGEVDSHDDSPPAHVVNVDNTRLPEVQLPGGTVTISSTAMRCGMLLGDTGRFYIRGGIPVRLVDDAGGEPRLEPIRPPALCSDLESVARLVRVVTTKDGGEQVMPSNCSESVARLLLESAAFRSALPAINVVSRCPVLIERDGKLVQVTGYDRQSGILASGKAVPEIPLPEAIELLNQLVADYRFATAGDKARALAATITPALIYGGLLGARSPIDLSEADDSQAGKGFRNKLTAGTYNSSPRTVTQRSGGVGSVQESFDAALVSGASHICLDNWRGKLDLPALESFLTEDSYLARVPYSSPAAIDPRRVIVSITSNSAEVTVDLANRCSCTRILKQPAEYTFATYPEGDLLDHVRANQPKYLGAVFAVIGEWHSRGKPMLPSADHDFRKWARTLGYITERVLGAGGLLVGHRAAQQRIASPGLTWLRDIAIAVQRAGKEGAWMRAYQVLEIMAAAGLDPDLTADADDEAGWLKAVRKMGTKLARQFRDDTISIDNHHIQRREVQDEQSRRQREYAFSSEVPKSPEVTPEVKAPFPEVPEPLLTISRAPAHTHVESSGVVREVRGCSGMDPWEAGISPEEAGL